MKVRILSSLVMLVIMIAVLALIHTPVFVAFLMLISAVAVFEIERVAQIKNLPIRILSIAFALCFPAWFAYSLANGAPITAAVPVGLFALLLLLFMLMRYDTTRFEHVAIAFFASIAVPFAFSVMVWLRDLYLIYPDRFTKMDGVYFFLMGLACSWVTDIGAYFTGRFLGKHKLSPKISPKKTVEGAIGGVIFAALINMLLLLIFNRFFFEGESVISYWAVLLISVLLAVFSMFGDLSASTIKRNYAIKDFGKLIPGHGGIMDRFDSCLFVFPALYLAITIVQAF